MAGILVAGAAQADIITFDQGTDPSAGSYTSFSTNGGVFDFTLQNGGPSIVDLGTGGFATANCPTGTCSDNGTQALYVFGTGAIRLTSPGNVFSVNSFDAAIATADSVSQFLYSLFGPLSPVTDNTYNSQITLTGQVHLGGTVSVTLPLLYTDPNYIFANKALSGFSDLDYLDFAYDSTGIDENASPSGDFAIDNIDITTRSLVVTPPTSVPEPGTLGLLGVGLVGFGWMRRKMKRSAA